MSCTNLQNKKNLSILIVFALFNKPMDFFPP